MLKTYGKYPLPTPDPSEQPDAAPMPVPTIYVRENVRWEYKRLVRELDRENAPTEDELNALGAEGWDLVSMISHAEHMYLYFKRLIV